MAKGKKNGKIEIYRLVFTVAIMLVHMNRYAFDYKLEFPYGYTFFSHAPMYVEFFFLISGFLMAKSIKKQVERNRLNGIENKFRVSEGTFFIKKKYMSVFPYHLVASALIILSTISLSKPTIIEKLSYVVDYLPTLFFIQISGIRFVNMDFTWYISCMIFAMALIYPLMSKYYDEFTRYFAPIVSILILGIIVKNSETLTGTAAWYFVCYKSFLRGLSEIMLGTVAFECSEALSKKSFTKIKRILFTAVEFGLFAFSLFYSISKIDRKYEIMLVPVFFIMIVISFSGQAYGEIFNNKFSYALGRLSLPLYLSQAVGFIITANAFTQSQTLIRLAVCLGANLIASIIVLCLGKALAKLKIFTVTPPAVEEKAA